MEASSLDNLSAFISKIAGLYPLFLTASANNKAHVGGSTAE